MKSVKVFAIWEVSLKNESEQEKEQRKAKNRKESMLAFSLISQLGIVLFASVAISLMIGQWLDSWLGTSPWLVFIFSIIGVATAFRNINLLFIKKFDNQNKPKP